MELTPLSTQLNSLAQIAWEEVTENVVKNSKGVRNSPMNLRSLRANIDKQFIVSRAQVVDGPLRRRSLEEEVPNTVLIESLVIQYKILFLYQSPTEMDANALVGSSFDTSQKRQAYISDLQDRSNSFRPVEQVEVAVDGWVPPPTMAPTPEPEKKLNIAVIAGGAVGGVALIVLIVLFACRKRGGGRGSTEKPVSSSQVAVTPSKAKVSTEILVEPQDDISTLGDPMFGQGGMMMGSVERDEMTAT